MKIGSLCTGYGGLDLAAEQYFNAQTLKMLGNGVVPQQAHYALELLCDADHSPHSETE